MPRNNAIFLILFLLLTMSLVLYCWGWRTLQQRIIKMFEERDAAVTEANATATA